MTDPSTRRTLDLTIAARVLDLVDRLPHLVGVTDGYGRVLWMNEAGRNFVGRSLDEPLTTAEIFTDEVFERYYAEIRPALLRREPWNGELHVRRSDGTLATVEAVVVGEVGPADEVRWLSTLAVDVTEHLEREARLSHMASHDPLTGLPNRTLLEDRLSVALSVGRRTGVRVAVLALDLDGFKDVNDAHGHAVGDRLLQQVTGRLEASVRPSDTVARMGGDEFVVVIHPPEAPDTAALVAERIREHLAEPPYVIGALALRISASIGLVTADPARDQYLAQLLAAADRGMYRAKRSGGDCVRAVELNEQDELPDTGPDLARALAQGHIVPMFEPVIDLRDGALTELTVEPRWMHPQDGLLSAEEFLDAALATGYADLVWWATTRRALEELERAAVHLPVEVPLTDAQLRAPDLGHRLRALRALAPRAVLRIQITAGAILALAADGVDLGEELADDGLELVLVDHGVERVPVAMLEALPLAAVKLAPGLAAELVERPGAIRAAAELAHQLGVPCIATGVTESAQLPLLEQLGVDGVEGPVNGDDWDLARIVAATREP